jgi:beta-lactamase regulating signal transducer with metallopeptidase domain
MAIELLFGMFLRAQLAGSLAITLVLLLRRPTRQLVGPQLAYGLWLLVPAAAIASLFPAMPECLGRPAASVGVMRAGRFVDWTPVMAHANALAGVWMTGLALSLAALFFAQRRFDAAVRDGCAGPAATGFWPRMVVPQDYRARFTADERALIRAHERAHMARRDPTTNLLMSLCLAASWMNPLAHLAIRLARLDQELSVDALVMAQYPRARRLYAEILLKAHGQGCNSPLACALALGAPHPLELRLHALGLSRVSIRRDLVGAFAIGFIIVGTAAALWVLAPI